MPLLDGDDTKTVEANIAELVRAGHPRDQAAAIAYHHAHPNHRHDDLGRMDAAASIAHAKAHTVELVRMHHSVGSRKRAVRVASSRHPVMVEVAYAKALMPVVATMRSAAAPVLAALPRMLEARTRARGDGDGWEAFRADAGDAKQLRDLLELARSRSLDSVRQGRLDALAATFAKRTSDVNREELRRQTIAALGVDIPPLDGELGEMMDHFVSENASLIRALHDRTMGHIETTVTRALSDGTPYAEVEREVKDRLAIAERHLRLISRDQVGKLNGRLSQSRHRDIGIDGFLWRTMRDRRVRPEHRELDGKRFEYVDPPVIDGEAALPGQPIACRCSGSPDFSGILDDVHAATAALSRRQPGEYGER